MATEKREESVGFEYEAAVLMGKMANRLRFFREYIDKSRQEIADDLKVQQHFLHCMETNGNVSLSKFVVYLSYLERIHNLNQLWVLTPDNSDVSMFMATAEKHKQAAAKRKELVLQEMLKFVNAINHHHDSPPVVGADNEPAPAQ